MVNKPGKIGTATETAVVRVLNDCYWPSAERRRLRGRLDLGDITGTPGIVWSVKGGHAAENASDTQISQWLARTEQMRANADADYGILVVKRKGIGPANAKNWWAIMRLDQLVRLTGADSYLKRSWLCERHVRLYLWTACDLLNKAGFGSTDS